MESYETEEQQVEALKKWWQKNGQAVMIGTALGVVVVLGWNYWQEYRKNQAVQASAQYNQMLKAVESGKLDSAQALAERLQSQYSGSDYAVFAGLMQAKLKEQRNDMPAAKQLLEKIAAGGNKQLANLARIRLLRLLLASKEYEQGLKLANGVDQSSTDSFAGLYDELIGDLYVGLDRLDQARTSYQSALRNGLQSPMLQMKLDDITAPEKLGK